MGGLSVKLRKSVDKEEDFWIVFKNYLSEQ